MCSLCCRTTWIRCTYSYSSSFFRFFPILSHYRELSRVPCATQSPILYVLLGQELQLCLTLCDPMNYSRPGSSAHGLLQARAREWAAISSCSGLADAGMEAQSPGAPAPAGRFFATSAAWEAPRAVVRVCPSSLQCSRHPLPLGTVSVSRVCASASALEMRSSAPSFGRTRGRPDPACLSRPA